VARNMALEQRYFLELESTTVTGTTIICRVKGLSPTTTVIIMMGKHLIVEYPDFKIFTSF
jgi:hypothetical protein